MNSCSPRLASLPLLPLSFLLPLDDSVLCQYNYPLAIRSFDFKSMEYVAEFFSLLLKAIR